MAKGQKNPGRLLKQVRQLPDEDVWRSLAHKMREECDLHYAMNLMSPIPASRLKINDKYRRLFDSHGSNATEPLFMADNHPTYWTALAEHEGGSSAKDNECSMWEAFEVGRSHPGYNPETYEIWDQKYATVLR